MRDALRAGRVVLALSLLSLSGCMAPLLDPRGTAENASMLLPTDQTADRAMSALAHGDTVTAEKAALGALRRDPHDPYALLAAGLTYQATGRYGQARRYYDVIIDSRMPGTIMMPGDNGVMQPRGVLDVAKANLQLVNKLMGSGSDAQGAGAGVGAASAPPDAEADVAGRFRILKELLDQGLITPAEYQRRRSANLGALLPFSAPPPARGLERPVPPDAAVIDRLRALATAVENREMTPAAQADERGVILDALLPARPAATTLPPLPPKDMLAEAKAVGRLERLHAAGLISAEEMAGEKQALERACQAALAGKPVEGTATGLEYGAPPAAAPQPAVAATPLALAAAPGWGVSLASARSEASAARSWARLKARFPEELGHRQETTRKVHLAGRGTRWRVIVGPLASREEAAKLCRTLKLHRQACDPIPF